MLCIGGRKSRNKVIVGEPAIGSLNLIYVINNLMILTFSTNSLSGFFETLSDEDCYEK